MENEQTPVVTPEVVADPNVTPSAPAVISPDRTAIIQKYEQQYFTPEPVATVADASVAPVAESVTSVAPAGSDAMAAVMAELATIKSQMAIKPPETPITPATQEDWLKLLAEGKKSEGEKALMDLLGPQIQEQAVQKALALMQAERAVTEYTSDIRTKNADIADMEPYIAMAAEGRIQQAQAAGRIKSPADYVTVYKEAINAEIENARKLTQKLRGSGAQAATVRQAEVVASQTLRPNPVNTQREAPPATNEPVLETTNDYFAKRKQQHAAFSGLSTAQGR